MLFVVQTVTAGESPPKEEDFALPTADKKTIVKGAISFPNSSREKKFVPIVFVGGSTSSRDGILARNTSA